MSKPEERQKPLSHETACGRGVLHERGSTVVASRIRGERVRNTAQGPSSVHCPCDSLSAMHAKKRNDAPRKGTVERLFRPQTRTCHNPPPPLHDIKGEQREQPSHTRVNSEHSNAHLEDTTAVVGECSGTVVMTASAAHTPRGARHGAQGAVYPLSCHDKR